MSINQKKRILCEGCGQSLCRSTAFEHKKKGCAIRKKTIQCFECEECLASRNELVVHYHDVHGHNDSITKNTSFSDWDEAMKFVKHLSCFGGKMVVQYVKRGDKSKYWICHRDGIYESQAKERIRAVSAKIGANCTANVAAFEREGRVFVKYCDFHVHSNNQFGIRIHFPTSMLPYVVDPTDTQSVSDSPVEDLMPKDEIIDINNVQKLMFSNNVGSQLICNPIEGGTNIHPPINTESTVSCVVKGCTKRYASYEDVCAHILISHKKDVIGSEEYVHYRFDNKEELMQWKEHVRCLYATSFYIHASSKTRKGYRVEYWRCGQSGAVNKCKYPADHSYGIRKGVDRKRIVDVCSVNIKVIAQPDGSLEASGYLFHVAHSPDPVQLTQEQTEALLRKQQEYELKKVVKTLPFEDLPSTARDPFKYLNLRIKDFAVAGTNPKKYCCPQCSAELDPTAWKYHESRGCADVPSRVLCLVCMEGFFGREAMMEHYSAYHVPLSFQTLKFENITYFEDFRYMLKKSGHNFKNRGRDISKVSSKSKFRCFIGVSCTAYIDVKYHDDGSMTAHFCDHHSHEFSENGSNLPQDEADDIKPIIAESVQLLPIEDSKSTSIETFTENGIKKEVIETGIVRSERLSIPSCSTSTSLLDLLSKFVRGRDSLVRLEQIIARYGQHVPEVQQALCILEDLTRTVSEMEE